MDPTGHYRSQTFTMLAWTAYASRIDTRIHDLETQAYWVGGIGGAIGGGIITAVAEVATEGAATPFAAGIFAFSSAAVGVPLGLIAGGADAMALQQALDYINTGAADLAAMGVTEFTLEIRGNEIAIMYCKVGCNCGPDGWSVPFYYGSLDNVAPHLSGHQIEELENILNIPVQGSTILK